MSNDLFLNDEWDAKLYGKKGGAEGVRGWGWGYMLGNDFFWANLWRRL